MASRVGALQLGSYHAGPADVPPGPGAQGDLLRRMHYFCRVHWCVGVSLFAWHLFCFQVAAKAVPRGYRLLLAVLYDELARKKWEDLSDKLGESFQVGEFTGVVDEVLLKDAEALHATLFKASYGARAPATAKVRIDFRVFWFLYMIACHLLRMSGQCPSTTGSASQASPRGSQGQRRLGWQGRWKEQGQGRGSQGQGRGGQGRWQLGERQPEQQLEGLEQGLLLLRRDRAHTSQLPQHS